ncbi:MULTISPECIES: hypothetical protein [Acinetobacter]|uniref:Glycine zipper family protein n=1 Tax=Acinetobacter indicus TaxID=756892 RepID=A0A6C0Y6L2_9GAMM|nr:MULTISPECIES: hypothetical protein [Acinetobacter]QIC71766.1 hypothetical protein FSC09_15350 [Acinetobacter indicus]QKQ71674.1 hypothetical protein E5Y90_15710 [Acinetobacter sp. 10FS3-1]
MKKHFKKSIVLSIVPVFVLAGCSSNDDHARLAVPNTESEVMVNDDGSYTQEVAAIDENGIDAAPDDNADKLLASYDEAKSKGYTGSLDDWIALVQLHDTNPEQAQAQAEESGFSGGTVLMGALAGAAVGAMLASSSNSRSGLANSSYSAQRYNNANNYAYSRPKDEQQSSSSGGGRGGSTAAAVAGSSNTARSGSPVSGSSNTVKSTPSYSASTKTTSSYTSSRPTASYSSVSRGGFGGAVSSGG